MVNTQGELPGRCTEGHGGIAITSWSMVGVAGWEPRMGSIVETAIWMTELA